MIQLILVAVLGTIFWYSVFRVRGMLMVWVQKSENEKIEGNDRVRELAWWAAIGVISVFIIVAEMLAKLVIFTL